MQRAIPRAVGGETHCAKARGDLFKDPEWLAFIAAGAGAIVEMNNVMLIPTDYSPMK